VLVRDGTAREVLLTAFVTGDRVVTGVSNVDVFSRSISCNSVGKNLSLDISRLLPPWPGGCNSGGHRVCSLDESESTFHGSDDSRIKMIPSCIKRLVNLEWLGLYGTGVSKIEGLENNVKLEGLDLSKTNVSKIEGLENNGNLKALYLEGTGVSR
jgi:Leucine-rich repeat (LRR) protein